MRLRRVCTKSPRPWYGPRLVRRPGTRRTAQAAALAALLVLAAASAAVATAQSGGASQQAASKTHTALLDLYSLDSQLAAARSRVGALEAASASLEHRRATLRQELVADRSTLKVSQRDLEARLRDLYEQGTVDPLAVLLGATSLQNAVNRLDALTSVADQSRQVVNATAAANRRFARTRVALAGQQRRLLAALSSARAAEASLEQTRSARLSYIAQLRAQQQRSQVTALVQQAQTIEHKSQTIQPPTPAPPSGGGGAPPPSGGQQMTVSATCYDLPGHTATGMPVGWGVVAVDPTVIPLGTKLYVPGYGNAVAADVGGAIKGRIIDLWMPYSSCMKWGRRTVTITVY